MVEKNKKILIISSNAIANNSNNGKTMKALFASFKKEQLSQLYFSKNENPNFDLCSDFYQFTDLDVLKEKIPVFKKNISKDNYVSVERKKLNYSVFSILKEIFKPLHLLREYFWIGAEKNSKINDWIKSVSPNGIFLYCGNLSFVYDFAIYISDQLNIPIFPFFSDDYAFSPKNNIFTEIQKKIIQKRYVRVLNRAPFAFCIGNEMCKFYATKFNKNFFPIMNSVFVPDKIPISNKTKNAKVININYIGGLTIGRDYSILQFAKSLNSVKSLQKVALNVYTTTNLSKKMRTLYAKNGVQLYPPVFGSDYERVRNESDILLHIESAKRKFYSLTMYSISTKIPEYLISGKFVFCYGPACIASFKLIKDNNIGITIDNLSSQSEQIETINDFLMNMDSLHNLRIKSFEYAKDHFDQKKNSKYFFNYINDYLINEYNPISISYYSGI